MNITLPILSGLQPAFDAIVSKDPGKIYITTDTGNIYLGSIKLGGVDGGRVIRDVAFDVDTQTFTFTYTDDTTKVVDLVLESVIKDISFDPVTKILTITLVSGATTQISLADLVDVFTGGITDTAAVTVEEGEITVDVTVSPTAGNALQSTANGLFVPQVTMPAIVNGNIVVGTGTGIGDSNRSIVGEITDSTNGSNVPDVTAVKGVLAIGTF